VLRWECPEISGPGSGNVTSRNNDVRCWSGALGRGLNASRHEIHGLPEPAAQVRFACSVAAPRRPGTSAQPASGGFANSLSDKQGRRLPIPGMEP
jgi:hypothetical protein